MNIKEELRKQKELILNGGKVDVNLFKVRSLFKKYFLKEEEAEENYQILKESWSDNHGNYGAHDSLNKRQRVAGLLDVMIEEMLDATDNSILGSKLYDQMKIFITHSSKNKNYGELLVELLRSLGVNENEIIFTSNVAYGIPVGQNIFNWLKSQIAEKPFVIYLLSEQYYDSIACLNEMGAAWIIENDHAAIFTPDFDLSSKEFQSGALDPREIGFYINDEDRILSFIQLLSGSFELSNNPLLISQNVKKFLVGISKIQEEPTSNTQPIRKVKPKETLNSIKEEKVSAKKADLKPVQFVKGDLYSKFLKLISDNKLKKDEMLLLHYMIDTSKFKLMTGWQEEHENSNIREWEQINDIKDILSKNYASVLRKFELRGFTEVSAVTSSDNPKEIKLKEEIASNILDLPNDVLAKLDEIVKRNFFEHADEDEVEEENDFPF